MSIHAERFHECMLAIWFHDFPQVVLKLFLELKRSVSTSLVPVVEKRLMDVKLGELGSWLGGRDFTPNGILQAIRRGD